MAALLGKEHVPDHILSIDDIKAPRQTSIAVCPSVLIGPKSRALYYAMPLFCHLV